MPQPKEKLAAKKGQEGHEVPTTAKGRAESSTEILTACVVQVNNNVPGSSPHAHFHGYLKGFIRAMEIWGGLEKAGFIAGKVTAKLEEVEQRAHEKAAVEELTLPSSVIRQKAREEALVG